MDAIMSKILKELHTFENKDELITILKNKLKDSEINNNVDEVLFDKLLQNIESILKLSLGKDIEKSGRLESHLLEEIKKYSEINPIE